MIFPKFFIPDRVAGSAMVESLADKYVSDNRLSKIAAKIGWKLGYTPEWKLDNPKDSILADAANILVETDES